jgi:hypothetical protein
MGLEEFQETREFDGLAMDDFARGDVDRLRGPKRFPVHPSNDHAWTFRMVAVHGRFMR